MKPDYSIGARNGLLEQKHFMALGNAIWLYLWFLDKQPKATDKVLGGQPITYQMFAESFQDVPRITYVRWLAACVEGGYITTLRTPRGMVVTINKSKKWSDVSSKTHHNDVSQTEHQAASEVSPMQHQKQSDVSKMNSDVSKMIHAEDVSKMNIQYKRNSLKKQKETSNTGDESPDVKEAIKKLYYECIKTYGLPVLNHNTLRAKINAMVREDQPEAIIKYLTFMRDQYQRVEMSYKPRISNALDFYTKRVQIREAIQDEVKSQQQSTAWRPKSKGVGKV